MTIFLTISAIILMCLGHISKVKRWEQYISVYEKPVFSNLLHALSVGHMMNTIIPLRIGDLFRIYHSGKHLKNGYYFAVATIVADIYIDILSVGFIFTFLMIIRKGGERLQTVAHFYIAACIILVLLTVLCVIFRKTIKKGISKIATIFNEKIEFTLLYTSFLAISSMKDIAQKIDKVKFVLYTAGMWTGYVASYVIFAEAIQEFGFNYSTSEIFTALFSGTSLYMLAEGALPLWAAYLVCPLLICLACAYMAGKCNQDKRKTDRYVLPQLNEADKLSFLRTYYSDDNRVNIQAYLEINNDAIVVEDNSAGSNASTVLILKDDCLYYRKYAFNQDGEKLKEQIRWIEAHQNDIPLPLIAHQRSIPKFSTYDMQYYRSAVGMFHFLHTMPIDDSWTVLRKALEDIRIGLHQKNCKPCDEAVLEKYIKSKVEKNLEIITTQSKNIRELEKYRSVVVNGRELKTLRFYRDMLQSSHLKEIFSKDSYSDIHGDLTIENIVCLLDSEEIDKEAYCGKIVPDGYYFIDPNTGNAHDSPFLDYAKLLQSLHGNYEFLMKVNSVEINDNHINYMMIKSEAYGQIYQRYREYLKSIFTKEEVLSVFYHEIIHWLRLMPYKIRKNDKLAVVFYTGMLGVLADVWEIEHEEEK